MNIGDLILNVSLAVGLFAMILLLSEQFKRGKFERQVRWLIRVFAVALMADFLLLVYYFYTTNLTVNYVWAYTSRDLPLIYKLAGAVAGSQGTLLYWSALIGIGSLWLIEKRGLASDFVKKAQIVVLFLGSYFISLTLLDSPFKTIYEINPELPTSFIPAEGAGLNPLLQDPWMAIHPPIVFIAYAAMTIPFAVAVVYLFKSVKREADAVYKEWIGSGVQWCRVSWLFLTLAIAIGGFWSYKVLGWGGFWAWDPVETSSLVPWLLLTAAMHALVEHSKNRRKYNILAPALVTLTFAVVVYATLVTRSGFFASIHAFGKGTIGLYLITLIGICALASMLLATISYLRVEDSEEAAKETLQLKSKDSEEEEKLAFVNKTNIFYITILLLLILTVVSFWGITYPAIKKLLWAETYGVFPSWFNIFSYIFFIPLMFMAGLCLNYRSARKERLIRDFIFFAALTFVTMLIKPTEGWNIVDYTSVVGPEKPLLLSLVGSISLLSFIPPSIYIIYSAIDRWNDEVKSLKKRDFKIKEIGVIAIHLGIIFILIGAVFSTMFTTAMSATLNVNNKDQIALVGGTEYGVRLLDYNEFVDYGEVPSGTIPGLSITQLYSTLASGPMQNEFTVHGVVEEVVDVKDYTYAKLVEGEEELWIAFGKTEIPRGITLIASGMLMFDFPSASLGRTFDVILFASSVDSYEGKEKEIRKATQQIEVAVYKGADKIGEGVARHIDYRSMGTTIDRVMIDRGVIKDVYVIFNGKNGDEIPLTIKIVPLINELWFGVVLFAVGITMILLFDPRFKVKG
ncbi:MAG: cytochrome c biogenesis protein CcsA [Candidatus Hydrothermarchaeales archaeon]